MYGYKKRLDSSAISFVFPRCLLGPSRTIFYPPGIRLSRRRHKMVRDGRFARALKNNQLTLRRNQRDLGDGALAVPPN
jgi:hypothetical protein